MRVKYPPPDRATLSMAVLRPCTNSTDLSSATVRRPFCTKVTDPVTGSLRNRTVVGALRSGGKVSEIITWLPATDPTKLAVDDAVSTIGIAESIIRKKILGDLSFYMSHTRQGVSIGKYTFTITQEGSYEVECPLERERSQEWVDFLKSTIGVQTYTFMNFYGNFEIVNEDGEISYVHQTFNAFSDVFSVRINLGLSDATKEHLARIFEK